MHALASYVCTYASPVLRPTYSSPGKAGKRYSTSVLWRYVPVHWLKWLRIYTAALLLACSSCNKQLVLDMASC